MRNPRRDRGVDYFSKSGQTVQRIRYNFPIRGVWFEKFFGFVLEKEKRKIKGDAMILYFYTLKKKI